MQTQINTMHEVSRSIPRPESSHGQRSNETIPDESFMAHSYKRNITNSPGRYATYESNISTKNSPNTLPTITTKTESNSTDMARKSSNSSFDIDADPLMITIESWLNEDNELPQIKPKNKRKSTKKLDISNKSQSVKLSQQSDPLMNNTARWLVNNDGADFVELASFDPASNFTEYRTQRLNDYHQPQAEDQVMPSVSLKTSAEYQSARPATAKTSNVTSSPRARLSFLGSRQTFINTPQAEYQPARPTSSRPSFLGGGRRTITSDLSN